MTHLTEQIAASPTTSFLFLEHHLKIRGTIVFSTFAGRKFVLASVRFPKPQNQLAVGSVQYDV
jgi:hypothetical protein